MSSINESDDFTQKLQFDALLSELKEKGKNNSEQGTLFEIFCKKILLTSPFFVDDVVEVWRWKEFPGNGGLHDNGIDLVALDKNNNFWAIQCKFYDKDKDVNKKDVDSFISASTRPFIYENKTYRFFQNYVFSTTDSVSQNASGLFTLFGPEDLFQCGIDWEHFKLDEVDNMQALVKKTPKPHQEEAINNVINGFKNNNRGRLIMACGTGKTFTSLKIVENYINTLHEEKINILYLVPSIPLLSQTILEWKTQTIVDRCNMFGICSDETAGQDRRSKLRDEITATMPIPATTDPKRINEVLVKSRVKVNFFFSTYQSIEVVKKVQDELGIIFAITICDEAHRTIGAYRDDEEDKSDFIKVHDSSYIHSNKRLYMTATEKIYSSGAKANAEEGGWKVYSMDDEKTYGPEFYYLSFGEAVSKQLLTDYRLLVLNIRKSDVANLRLPNNLIANLDDASKIIGALTALSKIPPEGKKEEFVQDPKPMKRVVTFCSTIAHADSVAESFNKLINNSCLGEEYMKAQGFITPKAKLITGKDNTKEKNRKLNWLRSEIDDGECRILTNARCLSEGVDVPSLDSIVFMAKKRSQVDIIQAVGRVMRKFGSGVEKKYGYIIIPVVINDEKLTDKTLSSNEDYKVVWQVVQALRSHDERLDTEINKVGVTGKLPANICVLDTFIPPISRRGYKVGSYKNEREEGPDSDNPYVRTSNITVRIPTDEELKENEKVFSAQLVKHCGNRLYWEDWSKDIGDVTNNVALKIKSQIEDSSTANKTFLKFAKNLRQLLNPNVSEEECISMLSEHIVTLPVLKSIFLENTLIDNNPITIIMESMVKKLNNLNSELKNLEPFYDSVRRTVQGVTSSEGRQEIIRKLFEKFFQYALPQSAEKFGIVYTPVEIVDFIIYSVKFILKNTFQTDISDKSIKILDPFTGTGTFIVRLLDIIKESCITEKEFEYKYLHDIWCNEIMLLSYYIALINIEDAYSRNNASTLPFDHAVLTDTFQLAEKRKKKYFLTTLFEEQEFNVANQKAKEEDEDDIRIIIGNPPYSAGQKSANDKNKNDKYSNLDSRIAETYLRGSNVVAAKSMYDSYVRAFRWASDRIADNGIISFVSNGSYIDSLAFNGFRRDLLKEFNNIYVFNLRGNCRSSGEYRKKEAGNVFGEGSRTPIAIIVLVKKEGALFDNYIRYYDIGDYLSREEKLKAIKKFKSIENIPWVEITPDSENDWINKKDLSFNRFTQLANKKGNEESVFGHHISLGCSTARDSWVYNFSKDELIKNIDKFVNFYNSQRKEYFEVKKSNIDLTPEKFVSFDNTRITWGRDILKKLKNDSLIKNNYDIRTVMYRPFVKKYLNFNKDLISDPSLVSSIFPIGEQNMCIALSTPPLTQDFSCMVSDCICDYHLLGQTQMIPLNWFDERGESVSLFDGVTFNGISDGFLEKCQNKFKNSSLTHREIFMYIYGVLHSKQFRAKYVKNLSKELPRIPLLREYEKYITVGKKLIDLHLNYENLPRCSSVKVDIKKENYRINVIKFQSKRKDVIVFNENVLLSNIPTKIYDYKLNGRNPIEWVIGQYKYYVNPSTQNIDDPNLFDSQKEGKYVFDLINSLITLSLQTLDLVDSLPEYEELK